MTKQVMDRRAADNQYLHKDFHAALNRGIEYLHRTFGEDAVRDYLRGFAVTWYQPLRTALLKRGLDAIQEHIQTMYDLEEAEVSFEKTDDELIVRIPRCPAVTHIHALGDEVTPLFAETTLTVNRVLCEDTPYGFECLDYDPETGRSVQRFFRRTS